MNKLEDIINEHLKQRVLKSELDNSGMISVIENLGSFLNLQTFSDYAKREGITYNGVLVRIRDNKVKVVELFGVKFVADND